MTDFAANQEALIAGLKQQPFVPVFQLRTHERANSLTDDAFAKVDAMYKGGIRQFEFLLRGISHLQLDDYIEATLYAIDQLAEKYPDAQFGVGTVSSKERMKKVAANPNVSFIVTAHWPGEEMIDIAKSHGKPIIPTVSHTEEVTFKEDDKIVAPGSEGADQLNPERIAELRKMGVETVKIFDFGKIADARCKKAPNADASNPKTKIAAGLVAIAEAITASYESGVVPEGQEFTAMTTGGVTKENLPFLAAGVKSPVMRKAILDVVGDTTKATPIIKLLERTTVVAGGTFITKEYDETPDTKALETLSNDISNIVERGKIGIAHNHQVG